MHGPRDDETCPCGDGKAYVRCCKRLHDAGGAGLGNTATETMRARYTAYVTHNAQFLLATWHPSTRPSGVEFSDEVEWHGLSVLASTGGSALEASGTVEFTARFRRGEADLELHELSRFTRVGGLWLYVDGVDPDSA